MADANQVLNLATIIREVDGNNRKGAAALAESILDHPRFRAALADEPAVPEGREPASVTGQPSDEELLETLDKATATFPPRHPEAEGLNAVEYPLALELRKARAVLARWGNPAPQPPAEGEVEELVQHLHHAAEVDEWDGASPEWCQSMLRAADLLAQRPEPIPALPEDATVIEPSERTILVPHQAPVLVAERPWEREGWCDEEGRCWCFFDNSSERGWQYRRPQPSFYDTHCLPHWAIPRPRPLPQQETTNG